MTEARDKHKRIAEAQTAIDIDFASLFGTELGQRVLKHLRKATIEMVGGPEITNDQLRHLEGQRFLVALIEQRVANGHKAKQRESKNVVLG
jgi:hypothetical protein